MMKVFKYRVPLDGSAIELPVGARILHVAEQQGVSQVWAAVDPNVDVTSFRVIQIFGTGHEIPNHESLSYINTFLVQDGMFVFHAFEHRGHI